MTLEESLAQMQGTPTNIGQGQVMGMAKDAWDGMSYLDRAALVTSPIPVVGQGLGLGADLRNMYDNPEERTLVNAGLALTNFIPGSKMMRGGAKGVGAAQQIVAGEHSKTIDKTALAAAKAMEKRGMTPEQIQKATGMWKTPGAPGRTGAGAPRWAYEIDDSKAMFNRALFDDKIAMGETARLKDVLNHPEFFEAYPAMKNYVIGLKDMKKPTTKASYQEIGAVTPTIHLGRGYYPGAKDKDVLSTILHELQHGVQSREMMSGGSSPTRELNKMMFEPDWMGRSPAAQNLEANFRYHRNPGEVQSRTVQDRMSMTPEQRAAQPFPIPLMDGEVY